MAISPDGVDRLCGQHESTTRSPRSMWPRNTAAPPSTSGNSPDAIAITPDGPPPTWSDYRDDDGQPHQHRHQHRRGADHRVGASPTPSPSPRTAPPPTWPTTTTARSTPIDLADNTPGPRSRWEVRPGGHRHHPGREDRRGGQHRRQHVTPIDTATEHGRCHRSGPAPTRGTSPSCPTRAPVAALSVTPANAGPGHRLQRLGVGGPVVAHHELRLELR